MVKFIKLFLIVFFTFFLTACTTNTQRDNQIEPEAAPKILNTLTPTEEVTKINNDKVQAEDEELEEEDKPTESVKSAVKYYKVVKVVDGDTIDADIDGKKERIRLLGINTPETVDPRKKVECFGKEASDKAKELLSGKEVALESDSSQMDRDKYGRLLRYVKTRGGLFYNLEIINQGYAYEYTYDLPYKYQKEFKTAQKYAQDNKLGLWADGACGK